MQTFLPLPDIAASVACLDNRRLGKQRVEAMQILNTCRDFSNGWANHPAVRMWRGHEQALVVYHNECIYEWVRRGFKNTMLLQPHAPTVELPPWFDDPAFHASHRSNLLRKDFKHYSQFGWTEPTTLEYVWPVQ